MQRIFCFLLVIFITPNFVSAQLLQDSNSEVKRSYNDIFLDIGDIRRNEIFSQSGFVRSVKINEGLELIPSASSGIDLIASIMKSSPAYITEALLIIPYREKTFSRLDAYNALGRIRDLKGRLYHSHTRDADVALFEDATRIESAKKTNAIADPPFALELPGSETIFFRLKDINFGNSYYRADITVNNFGINYHMTNFKTLSYLFFPVLKEEKFSSALYIEPVAEGMLIYSMAGADASDFIANRIDIPSAISKRLEVFIAWIADGLTAVK